MKLTALSWNLHKCKGTDGERNPGRVVSALSAFRPDIAILQECDLKFGRKRGLLDSRALKHATGLEPADGPDCRGSLGWRGNMLLVGHGIECISSTRMDLPSLEPRGAVIWRLSKEEIEFDVIGFHLSLVGTWRTRQAATLAAEIALRKPVPTIAAGDTNDWWARSVALQPLEELLDTRSERHKTFPAKAPLLPLDRIMAGRGAKVLSISAKPVSIASDHLPLIAEIEIKMPVLSEIA